MSTVPRESTVPRPPVDPPESSSLFDKVPARFVAMFATMTTLTISSLMPVTSAQVADATATTQTTLEQLVDAAATRAATQATSQAATQAATQATTQATTQAATRAATRATTREIVEQNRDGDLFHNVVEIVESTGVGETVVTTPLHRWGIALGFIAVGIVVGRLLRRLFDRFAQRSAERVQLRRAVVLNSFGGPLSAYVVMMGFAVGLFSLSWNPVAVDMLVKAFQLINVVLIGWLLFNLVDIIALLLQRISRRRQGNLSVMLVPTVTRTLRAVLVIVLGLFAANNILRWEVGSFLTALGIAGLAVSLAAQDTLRNLFGSIMIFVDQPFAIGDTIRFEPHEGIVDDIGFRSTRLRTADGFVVSIPNGTIAAGAIVNMSRRPAIRRTIELTLSSSTTSPTEIRKALAIIRDVLNDPEVKGRLDEAREPARVAFDDLKTAQSVLRITYRFRGSDYGAYLAHAENLNLLLMERLGSAGIAFAASESK